MKMEHLRLIFILIIAVGSAELAARQLDICASQAPAEAICGIPAPEDIVALPDGRHLLLSPFGGLRGEHPDPLYLFDTKTLEAQPVTAHYAEGVTPRWDEGLCPKLPGPVFPSHGVHLSKRNEGVWQLLAVNHERESVEMFEIDMDSAVPTLIWRGCVVLPEGSVLNDVSALPDGGFLVSHMISLGEYSVDQIVPARTVHGPSGYVLRWRPGLGVDRLAGSDGDMVSGVAMSDDGLSVFIAEGGASRVKQIAYESGALLGTVDAASDNFSRTGDGRLLITGAPLLTDDCFTGEGLCQAPFEVRAITMETLESEVIFKSNGEPMGAGSVAVILGEYMYIGSFVGDRFLRVRLENTRLSGNDATITRHSPGQLD